MNANDISPGIKQSLRRDIERKIPMGLHERIMHQVKLAHMQNIAAPGYGAWIVFGLLLAAIFIAIPLLSLLDYNPVSLSGFEIPEVNIPMYVWLCLFIPVILWAIDDYLNKPKLQKA